MTSGETIEQMQETLKRHTPYLARGLEASLLAPALPSRAKALRIQERWPSVDVVQLELVKGVTPVLACSEDTRSLALYRAAHTATPPRRRRCPCGIRVPARSEKLQIRKKAILLRRDPTMVCSDQCELCGGACC